MPGMGSFSSMFYSWDVGPVHFVAVNTEAYYFLNYGLGPLVTQYEWLKRDLAEANKLKNRSVMLILYTYLLYGRFGQVTPAMATWLADGVSYYRF